MYVCMRGIVNIVIENRYPVFFMKKGKTIIMQFIFCFLFFHSFGVFSVLSREAPLGQRHKRMGRDVRDVSLMYGPEVASDPKYYQNNNVIRMKIDFIVKF